SVGGAQATAGAGNVPWDAFERAVGVALDEDLGDGTEGAVGFWRTLEGSNLIGDPTSEGLHGSGNARLAARQPGVIAGLAAVQIALEQGSQRLGLPQASLDLGRQDGDIVAADTLVGHVRGPSRVLLAAERTLLNFLGRLSGVASLTGAFVAAVAE